MVEFFSAAMVVRVCRYRSWRAAGDSVITMDASFSARDAFISPSAAITWGGTTTEPELTLHRGIHGDSSPGQAPQPLPTPWAPAFTRHKPLLFAPQAPVPGVLPSRMQDHKSWHQVLRMQCKHLFYLQKLLCFFQHCLSKPEALPTDS